jgi:hypothetical protein
MFEDARRRFLLANIRKLDAEYLRGDARLARALKSGRNLDLEMYRQDDLTQRIFRKLNAIFRKGETLGLTHKDYRAQVRSDMLRTYISETLNALTAKGESGVGGGEAGKVLICT